MRQYCRYCAFCFEADDYRCSNHPKQKQPHWTEEEIKRENHCPNFELSDMGDLITGRMYHPREEKPDDGEQIRMYHPREEKPDDGEQISMI